MSATLPPEARHATLSAPNGQRVPTQRIRDWQTKIRAGDFGTSYRHPKHPDRLDRSRAYAAAAVGLFASGASSHLVRAELLRADNRDSWTLYRPNGKPRTEADRIKRVDHLVARAQLLVERNPTRHEDRELTWALMQTGAAADGAPWGGQSGSGDYLTLKALHQLAQTVGNLVLFIDSRSLGELTGRSHVAANGSLTRLAAAGVWLRLVAPATDTEAAVYRILTQTCADVEQTGADPDLCDEGSVPVLELAQHDAFCYRGLGLTAARVLAALGDSGRSTVELALQLGMSPRTVVRHLRVLHDYDLAHRSGIDGTWARVEHTPDELTATLDELATVLGVAGTSQRRKETHQRQREAYELLKQRLGSQWTHGAHKRHRNRPASSSERGAA